MPLDALTARRVYDRIGRFQDSQRVYEDAATRRLTHRTALDRCSSVFELGCGTGRYAAELLATVFPSDATYVGMDVSPRMATLARNRLAPWSDRADVGLLDPPALALPGDTRSFDRFLAVYVFDLLSNEDAERLVSEAARLLMPGGVLGVVSLTNGTSTPSRLVSSRWAAVANRWPRLVGGCRPIDGRALVEGPDWSIEHDEVTVKLAVPSQVIIARRIGR